MGSGRNDRPFYRSLAGVLALLAIFACGSLLGLRAAAGPKGLGQTSATPQSSSSSSPTQPQASDKKTRANGAGSATPKADLKKAKEAYKRGLRAEKQEDWDAAYEAYSDASNWAPDDSEYALHRAMAHGQVVQKKLDLAERQAVSGEVPAALRTLRQARELDPSNKVIRERLKELAALDPSQPKPAAPEPELASEMRLEHLPGKQNFRLHGRTKDAYEEVARRFGVQVAFDTDMRSVPVRVDADDLDFATAVRILGEATQTFWRPLTKHLFFVADDTPQKRKDFDISVVRTVLFSATETDEQMTEISRLVREVAGITRSDLDKRSRTLTMRASPRAIALASDVIEDIEKPAGEMVLEIEVLQLDRTFARNLGVTPPQTAKVYTIPPNAVAEAQSGLQGLIAVLTQIFGQPSSVAGLTPTEISSLISSGQLNVGGLIPPLVAFGGGATTFLATLPGAAASFSEMLSLVRHGRRILLRAEDGQPATFFVGSRVPVSLAQYSPSLGGTGVNVPGVSGVNFPTTNLPTGTNPDFVTTVDVNADNFQDVIAANYTDGTLSIFLGNGDGTFQNPITPPPATGKNPVCIATGSFDANNNTNVDLAVANQTDNTLSILLGNGDGTFTAAANVPTGHHPSFVVASALKPTGLQDLIVANQNDNTISVFTGNGDGTFTHANDYPTGHGPTGLAIGDFNGDGNPDVAVTNQTDNSVSVYLGNGDGTFQTPHTYATGQTPVYVATADFNGDSLLDLATANMGVATATNAGDNISILLGNGDGTFGTAAVPRTDFPAGTTPTSIAVADFNVDGIPDLAVAAQGDNAVSIMLGLGEGTFGSFFQLPVQTNPDSISTAEFDATGQADLAVANNVSNTVSVILNSTTFSIGNGLAGSQFPSSQYIDVGLKLKATPRIHLNHEVTLQLEFEISSLAGSSYNNIPVISSQTLHQTVRVKEDETAAIGAFREPQYTRSLNGVPALGGVPGAGLLGADVNTSKEDTELVILVTPHIVAREARKDHTVYAGRGAPEGPGALGPTRDERQAPLRQPRAQPQPPPPGQGEPPAQPEPGQQPEPQPEPGAQPEPQTEPPPPQQ